MFHSKETKYNGYNFRSRAEARWAIFFDAFGIKYHYEYQDFILEDGIRYLPDFWLPEFMGGCHAEVKGKFTDVEKQKCKQLALLTNEPVLLLEGVPDHKFTVWYVSEINQEIKRIIEYYGTFMEDRMFCDGEFVERLPGCKPCDMQDGNLTAINESRSARFEHFQDRKGAVLTPKQQL